MLVGRGRSGAFPTPRGDHRFHHALTDAAVPTTPEWTITDLAEHVGRPQHSASSSLWADDPTASRCSGTGEAVSTVGHATAPDRSAAQ
jgi:hypothetical protein